MCLADFMQFPCSFMSEEETMLSISNFMEGPSGKEPTQRKKLTLFLFSKKRKFLHS